MEKINVAELLRNCPRGMELYSPIYGNGILTKVADRIHVKFPKEHNVKCFRPDGRVSEDGEIMIFPKGKTTWEGFIPPCKFKDGDVLFVDCSDDEDKSYRYIFILNKPELYGKWHSYCHLDGVGDFHSKETYLTDDEYNPRFATEEEKQKLFQAIKDNGYKWNAETKTLEKLSKFKVGDRVKKIATRKTHVIGHITESGYVFQDEGGIGFIFGDEHIYELVPNKFDINTLVPFESRVLVRDSNKKWRPAVYGFCNKFETRCAFYAVGGCVFEQCIPYEGNEHLLGTTNDCDEYFKTWK